MSIQPLISVIIPVYKTAAYLRKCLDSVIGQTYLNLEIILVDDGSPDDCPAICDEYAERDDRVHVIHKGNGGLSDARNTGMAAATGAYISFVDSDDRLSPHFLACLLGAGADIAQCGFTTREPANLAETASFQPMSAREMALQQCQDGSGAYTVVWNKLWRRDILRDLHFPTGKQHEDEFFSWRAYQQATRCAVTTAKLYYYRQREGSIMSRGFGPGSLDRIEALRERAECYRAAGEDELSVLTQAVLSHQLRSCLTDIRSVMPERMKFYRDLMCRAYRNVLSSSSVGLGKKISLTLQMLSPKIYMRWKGGRVR